ncbi:MAG: 50S ribosomal protein L5 [Phycisphaerales bacterium JB063]
MTTATTTAPRMKEKFQTEVWDMVRSEYGVTNPMALPRLEKIVLTVGMGNQLDGTKLNPKAREQVISDLSLITGQRPIMKKAKKAVSNFKLRVGYEVGAMVTVRGDRMWEFFDRLVSLAIPRIKDFRGLKDTSFDGRGSYSFGITEQGIFPEIDMASAQYLHGMNITLVFKNSTNEISKAALKTMGFPFVKPVEKKKKPA